MSYYTTFSKLPKEEKLSIAKEYRDEAWFANLSWLESAEIAHKFKVGDQWSDEEKTKLHLQGREPLVWNYIHPAIELAVGVRVQNPVRIYPYPTEKSDDFLCEVLEDIVTHIDNNQLDAHEEESIRFENSVITGIGDIVVDVGPDPDNPEELRFYENALDAYEVLVDPMSKKSDLSDARYIIYEKWITAEDFQVRYPTHIKDMEEIFSNGIQGLSSGLEARSNNSIMSQEYVESSLFEYYDSQNKRILVTHLEIREAYKRYYYTDDLGQSVEITKEEVKDKKELLGSITEIYDTKVYWLHYTYDRILWEGDSPVYRKSFSLCRGKAYVDRSKRQHTAYGIVKVMMDPQKECNRRWMHTLKLLSKQGAGVMAEVDAFHDLEQAQDSWNDPDAITFMARGGLNKVKEKAVPIFPDGPMRLEEMNKDAMKHISGINPDLMGVAQQRREPGINLKLRQQQGMTMLSKLFESDRRVLKEIYKRKLEIIVRYMPDTQIRKILGETDNYTFQQGYIIDQKRGLIAPIRKLRDLDYNVRMEDAPGGMNKLMSELAIFMEMMEKRFPVDPNVVIDKLDLSPIEKADWKTFIATKQKAESDMASFEMELKKSKMDLDGQLGTKKIELENSRIQTLATVERDKLQAMAQTQAGKAQMAAQMQQENLQVGTQDKAHELQVKADIEEGKLQQKTMEAKANFALKIAEMDAAEKRDLFGILKFVTEQQKQTTTATPAVKQSGVDATPADEWS